MALSDAPEFFQTVSDFASIASTPIWPLKNVACASIGLGLARARAPLAVMGAPPVLPVRAVRESSF
jgi:hypothetical protein